MTTERFTIEHQSENTRYVLIDRGDDGAGNKRIGTESYVDLDGKAGVERIFYSTFVSPEYGGQGLASVLVRAASDDTVAGGAKIVPVCPYVVNWMTKHPEYDEHTVKPTPTHLAALPARD